MQHPDTSNGLRFSMSEVPANALPQIDEQKGLTRSKIIKMGLPAMLLAGSAVIWMLNKFDSDKKPKAWKSGDAIQRDVEEWFVEHMPEGESKAELIHGDEAHYHTPKGSEAVSRASEAQVSYMEDQLKQAIQSADQATLEDIAQEAAAMVEELGDYTEVTPTITGRVQEVKMTANFWLYRLHIAGGADTTDWNAENWEDQEKNAWDAVNNAEWNGEDWEQEWKQDMNKWETSFRNPLKEAVSAGGYFFDGKGNRNDDHMGQVHGGPRLQPKANDLNDAEGRLRPLWESIVASFNTFSPVLDQKQLEGDAQKAGMTPDAFKKDRNQKLRSAFKGFSPNRGD